MSIDVADVLDKSNEELEREWKNAITVEGKLLETAEEIRRAFNAELDMGHKFIPLGKCDNFDYEKGCQGHVG